MPKTWLARHWPVVLGGALLLVHVRAFDFVTDDAYVSFVYARNLARHGQLVYNLGERVEGYTNFLWTLLLAFGALLRFSLERFAGILAALFSLGTIALVTRAPSDRFWTRAVAPLLLAGCSAFACWTSGGLETAMFTFLLTAAALVHLDGKRELLCGALFALATLTRPEGAMFFALACVHAIVLERRVPVRRIAIYLGLVLPYLAFRVGYYGAWVPNTYYVKRVAIGDPAMRAQGLRYLQLFARDFGVWLVLPLLIPAKPIARWQLTGVFAIALGWHVVRFGGDFMGLHRLLVPLLPLAALHVQSLVEALPRRWSAVATIAVLGSFALRAPAITATARRESAAVGELETPAFLATFAREEAVIGRWFGTHARREDLLTVGGAGALVYYADTRAIDIFGLTDAYIARHVPAKHHYPGHQRVAPLDYLLSRRPDFIVHFRRLGPAPYVPGADERAYWRALGFHWVAVQLPDGNHFSFLKRRERTIGPLGPAHETD